MARYIIGNWKMLGNSALVEQLLPDVASFAAARASRCEIVICPAFPLLSLAALRMQGGFLALGAQDVSAHAEGAYTGEVSAAMLREAGCRYVIVGHSERRAYHGETDAEVKAKAEAALGAGLLPILCVGETLEQREAGDALAVVEAQLRASAPDCAGNSHFLLAYEPVWAIGSGRTPTDAEIAEMHGHLAAVTQGRIPLLYGGSVKAANAQAILQIANVAGVLVGGASVKCDEFCSIIAAAEE